MNVTLIGYGSGNVASVRFALERLGARVRITDDPADVAEAERIILPGVGAAGYAMQRLKALDLIEPLRRFQRPLLGVCLGQQLLFDASAEDGGADLLGLIPGRVDWAYFVHGYVCPDGPATLAAADYGAPVPAVVNSANRWGCQFHPERSAALGARILKNFLELPA